MYQRTRNNIMVIYVLKYVTGYGKNNIRLYRSEKQARKYIATLKSNQFRRARNFSLQMVTDPSPMSLKI